ncbi:hypothetical protein F0562_018010 [Nyssa sinensis]|uniref:Uncharacterized protein n=1 Tax=Nyssa sinensis TaxID=561372 RepID=A0A5J4ZC56_9ASTE|nr:hypothetical protein F0562_018010 [Nyssa sinensis]
MLSCLRFVIVMAGYLQLFAILLVMKSDGRDLRPSEHGLGYQNSTATGENSADMMSFFGGSLSSTAPGMPWPEARNMSNSSQYWNNSDVGGGRDHVREVLLVASLACGITGVALLAAAVFIFAFHLQKKRSSPSPLPQPQPPAAAALPLALPSTSDEVV